MLSYMEIIGWVSNRVRTYGDTNLGYFLHVDGEFSSKLSGNRCDPSVWSRLLHKNGFAQCRVSQYAQWLRSRNLYSVCSLYRIFRIKCDRTFAVTWTYRRRWRERNRKWIECRRWFIKRWRLLRIIQMSVMLLSRFYVGRIGNQNFPASNSL